MQVGINLRILPKEKRVTQAEVAQKIGITQSVVAVYGRNAKRPDMGRLPAIAKALEALYGLMALAEGIHLLPIIYENDAYRKDQ